MDNLDPDLRIDIRDRLRAHGARQLVVARMAAPADWQGELRRAIAQHQEPRALVTGGDLKLFLQSFAMFFTATMVFFI